MFWLGLKRGPNSYIAPSDFKLKNYAQKITSLKTPSIKALLTDLKICYKAVKSNKLLGLISTSAISRAAPSFIYFFDFYLKLELGFNTKDFTFKYLLRDLLFYLSLILMNKVFKNFSKSFYLKFIITFYFFIVLSLVFLIDEGPTNVLKGFTSSVLIIYQSL